MKVESQVHENLAEIIAVNIVGGEEKTAKWEGTHAVPYLDVGFDGATYAEIMDRHHGAIRTSRSYQIGSDWSGREVRNERQVSVATLEDLEAIANELGLTTRLQEEGLDLARFMSQALATNLVITGPAVLKQYLGPGTRLFCGEPSEGAILDMSEAHLPCKKPAAAIAQALDVGFEALKVGFKSAAEERRGYMASVFSPGRISLGDSVAVQLPIDNRIGIPSWQPET